MTWKFNQTQWSNDENIITINEERKFVAEGEIYDTLEGAKRKFAKGVEFFVFPGGGVFLKIPNQVNQDIFTQGMYVCRHPNPTDFAIHKITPGKAFLTAINYRDYEKFVELSGYTLEEAYLLAQEEAGFKNGDLVYVDRTCDGYEKGWNAFGHSNAEVSVIKEVVSTNTSGVLLDDRFYYPFFCLKKLNTPTFETMVKHIAEFGVEVESNEGKKTIITSLSQNTICTIAEDKGFACSIYYSNFLQSYKLPSYKHFYQDQ